MEKTRQLQIMQKVEKAIYAWQKNISSETDYDDIEDTIEMITHTIAFGIIIVSGKNNPSAYIGTCRQCMDLKENYGGQAGAISNVWYWIGDENADTIGKIVKNSQKNLIIPIPPTDLADTILNVSEACSIDIKYGNTAGGRASYIGNYRVCTLLKAKYNGKIGKSYNHWYWIGQASFHEITKLYKAYQSRSKRFRRKRVVLQNYA